MRLMTFSRSPSVLLTLLFVLAEILFACSFSSSTKSPEVVPSLSYKLNGEKDEEQKEAPEINTADLPADLDYTSVFSDPLNNESLTSSGVGIFLLTKYPAQEKNLPKERKYAEFSRTMRSGHLLLKLACPFSDS